MSSRDIKKGFLEEVGLDLTKVGWVKRDVSRDSELLS